MFEFLIGILVMAAVIYAGFDIYNRIYTREPATDLDKRETATDLDKWEADHIDILISENMGEWLGRRDKRIEEGIKAAINEKCHKQGGPIDQGEIVAIIERFLGGYKE